MSTCNPVGLGNTRILIDNVQKSPRTMGVAFQTSVKNLGILTRVVIFFLRWVAFAKMNGT